MATTKIPVWIRSEYVTIVSPPFVRSGGQEAPLMWSGELTACRLSVAPLSAYHTLQQNATRPSGFHKGGFYVQISSGILKTLNKRGFLLLLRYLSFFAAYPSYHQENQNSKQQTDHAHLIEGKAGLLINSFHR